MKYCLNCQKTVNVNRTQVFIGIADIWNDHCETCGQFIDSGFVVNDHQSYELNKVYNEEKEDE